MQARWRARFVVHLYERVGEQGREYERERERERRETYTQRERERERESNRETHQSQRAGQRRHGEVGRAAHLAVVGLHGQVLPVFGMFRQ